MIRVYQWLPFISNQIKWLITKILLSVLGVAKKIKNCVGFCKSVSVKRAVQILAVGGAKNGGRGLEKNPTLFVLHNQNKHLKMPFSQTSLTS
jgi:hypothetical protein